MTDSMVKKPDRNHVNRISPASPDKLQHSSEIKGINFHISPAITYNLILNNNMLQHIIFLIGQVEQKFLFLMSNTPFHPPQTKPLRYIILY